MIREYEVKTGSTGSGGTAKGLMIIEEYYAGDEGEHKPGGVGWCTDGQGASWIEGSVDLHWSVVFFSGFFVGAVAVWGLWYVW